MATKGWGRIPLFKLDNYVLDSKYKIIAVYIDVETDEFVIEYEIVE